MRKAPSVREAVVAMDMAAAARITSISRMRTYLDCRAGWTGAPLVRRALDLADEESRSPQETRARLIWVLDAGLPRPHVNQPLFTREGRLLGYPDLLDVESGLVAEYDGDDHRASIRHSEDVDREDLFRRHLLEVTHLTGADTRDTAKTVARLHAARARAHWLPPETRPWTLRPPATWTPTLPLDVEFDLRGEPD
jgi:hypothetical protein